MAEQDWKTVATVFIVSLVVMNYIVLAEQQHKSFEISSTHIKYHSNWTQANAELQHVKELQDAYKLQGIKTLDFSLSMSQLSFDKIQTLLPARFAPYQTIKLNLANNPINSGGVDYILSLIPNGVANLQLGFDSISADEQLGQILAKRLNNLNSLKSLKISLILAVKNDSVLDSYLRFGRLGERLESYSLVLIGNGLTENSLTYLQTHLARANLTKLDLNFYSNKLGAAGAEIVSKSILSQKNLDQLSLDFYFNNITEVGTEALCQNILKVNHQNLKSLYLNLDFNYIKNEGAKAVGNLLSQMTNLKSLHLGVASKNFAYLGFKQLVNGLSKLTELEELSFKCGVNRVGPNGAVITKDLLLKLKKLTKLSLNFYENYVGDEGVIELTKAVVGLQHLSSVYLNFGFNDCKGYGLIKSLELLAKKTFAELYVSFSSNQFQDSEINLIKDDLRQIITKTEQFEFEFMETAISKRKAAELEKVFASALKTSGNKATIHVNSVITEEQQITYNSTAKGREEKLQQLRKADKQGKLQDLASGNPEGKIEKQEEPEKPKKAEAKHHQKEHIQDDKIQTLEL